MKRLAIKKANSVIVIIAILMTLTFGMVQVNATTITATGKVDASSGAYLRKGASTSTSKITLLKNNTELTLKKEVFTKKGSTKKENRWYYVSVNGKTGYIRSDCVDSIAYSSIRCKTTAKINYRKGAGTSMPSVGTIKKNTYVYKVLPAKASGSSTTWYKIKKDSKYYYVSGKYIKEDTSTEEPIFTQSDIIKPTNISEGCSFSIGGTINCNQTIQTAKVGVVDSNGNWKICVTKAVNAKSFNFSSVDANVKFGSLAKGNYYYRCDLTVNGKTYKEVNSSFAVKIYKSGELLGDTAVNLAWPLGTSSKIYSFKGGYPVPEYKTAYKIAFGTEWSNASKSKAGASCDIFVSIVCRYSGFDTEMPKSTAGMYTHCTSSPKWQTVDYHFNESELRHGDVIVYEKDGGKHAFMYVVVDGKGCIAKAEYTTGRYPRLLLASGQRPVTGKNTVKHMVFRAAE